MTDGKPRVGYRSSVLGCNVDDDGCYVCKFMNGDSDPSVMLEVIRILDAKLAKSEQQNNSLLMMLVSDDDARDYLHGC